MADYKTGALARSKYYTPFQKTPLKWIPRSKSGASHTRIGNVWEYAPAGEETDKSVKSQYPKTHFPD